MIWPRISDPNRRRGVTLIELVMVILLVAVLVRVLDNSFVGGPDSQRWEATRLKLEALKAAIIGDAKQMDTERQRLNFGFLGDMGNLPASLTDLMTQGAQPTWTYNSALALGAGWRGPYVSQPVSNARYPMNEDEWGNAFLYSTSPQPVTITSLGSDGAAGGSLYATDIQVQINLNQQMATVSGLVSDDEARSAGATVNLYAPSAGSIATYSTSADANGYFTFANVPLGVRSVQVTSGAGIGPKQISVDRSDYTVPTSLLNFFGKSQAVRYITGSATSTNSGKNALASLESTYESNLQLAYVTVTCASCTAGTTVSSLILDDVAQSFGAGLALGTRQAVTAVQTVPANSAVNSLELDMSTVVSGGTHPITVLLEWTTTTQTDSVTFTPP